MLYDRRFPSRLKGKFYRTTIKPTLLYRTECWPVKKIFEHKMEVAEMCMLRWMYGHTLLDRIRNQEFRDKLRVAPISGKMRENRLRWFGHVQRKTLAASVRSVKSIIVEGKSSRRRPERTWDEQIKVDLRELNLSEGLTKNRGNWRRHILVLDYWCPRRILFYVLAILLFSFLFKFLCPLLFYFVRGSTHFFYRPFIFPV